MILLKRSMLNHLPLFLIIGLIAVGIFLTSTNFADAYILPRV